MLALLTSPNFVVRRIAHCGSLNYKYTLQIKKRIAHFTPFFYFYFNEIAVSINVHDLNVIM